MAFRKIKGHTHSNERAERNKEIYSTWEARKAEMSQDELGELYGLTGSRINQIIKRQAELARVNNREIA